MNWWAPQSVWDCTGLIVIWQRRLLHSKEMTNGVHEWPCSNSNMWNRKGVKIGASSGKWWGPVPHFRGKLVKSIMHNQSNRTTLYSARTGPGACIQYSVHACMWRLHNCSLSPTQVKGTRNHKEGKDAAWQRGLRQDHTFFWWAGRACRICHPRCSRGLVQGSSLHTLCRRVRSAARRAGLGHWRCSQTPPAAQGVKKRSQINFLFYLRGHQGCQMLIVVEKRFKP